MKKALIFLIILFTMNSIAVNAETSILEKAVMDAPGTPPSDWSAIALTVSECEFDKATYIDNLGEYITKKYQTKTLLSANKSTEWHRIIIAVAVLGYDPTDFYGINLLNDGIFYRENIGKQGLNGYIWALIALSVGEYAEPVDAINSKATLIDKIVSAQNEDGSFSLNESEPSCDITAMAIYALSEYISEENVKSVVDKAVNYLSSVQNEDGSFSENSISNAESTAQVIMGISALGIDVKNDYRFPMLSSALLTFKTEDGFSHTKDGSTDLMATYQSTCAIVATEKCSAVYAIPFFENSNSEFEQVEKSTDAPIENIVIEKEVTTESTTEAIIELENENSKKIWNVEPSEDNGQAESKTNCLLNSFKDEKSDRKICIIIFFSLLLVWICVIIFLRKRMRK